MHIEDPLVKLKSVYENRHNCHRSDSIDGMTEELPKLRKVILAKKGYSLMNP